MLRISQTYLQLGNETNWGRYEFKTKNAELSLQTTKGELTINKELPRVLIDQSECFSEEGRKSNSELADDAAQESYRNVLEYVQKKNNEGEMLRDIRVRAPKNVVALIAQNNLTETKEFNIDTIPKSRPKVEVTGSLSFDYKPGTIQNQSTEPDFSVDFEKSKTNIYVKQWNSINIEYIGNNIDVKL